MARNGKWAAYYVRVSPDDWVQVFSLDAQERVIIAYCKDHGYQIVAPYRDEGRSARSDDLQKRPAFVRRRRA